MGHVLDRRETCVAQMSLAAELGFMHTEPPAGGLCERAKETGPIKRMYDRKAFGFNVGVPFLPVVVWHHDEEAQGQRKEQAGRLSRSRPPSAMRSLGRTGA